MNEYLKEELQETLTELQKSRLRERRFAEENDAILTAISSLSAAQSKQQMFNALLTALKKYIHFDDALVLSKTGDEQGFRSFLSTDPIFDNTRWPTDEKFTRVLAGECLVMYDPSKITLFQTFNQIADHAIYSALICGFSSEITQSVIILVGKHKGQFNLESKNTLSRLMPLVTRAMQEIDQKEKLQLLVDKRTQELENNRQRFIDFAQSTGDWLWETDNLLDITYHTTSINSALVQKKENLLTSLNNLDKGYASKRISVAISKFEPFADIELAIGENQYISISGRPYFNEKGEYLGYRGSAKDITNRRKQLQALKIAQQHALKASKAKSEFLAVMSHEIRTPLSTIFGFMDILKDSNISDEQAQTINKMESSAELLGVLISDILDLSKIEAGHFKLDNQSANLPGIIRDSVAHHDTNAKNKGIELKVEIDSTVPEYIEADSTRFTQILFNLVGNAVKFTSEGEVSVNAKASGNTLVVKVTDTGIGIPEDNINKLFDAFQQADSSITRTYGGTGLGLAITKKIVKLMDGDIDVQSTPGKGSCFTVRIPFTKTSQQTEENSQGAENNKLIRRKILLVEDNNTNQMLIQMLLHKLGHEVALANNGLESVDILTRQNKEYDLIFMDLSMPVMDGLEATSIIRSKQITTPIIALTAHAMESDKERCLKAGMNGFVTKPIRSTDLKRALQEVFN